MGRANQVARPGQYDELLRFDLVYRKTIFDDLSPSVRQTLWRERFSRFRAAHTGLTREQLRVLDRADALLAEPTLFVEPSSEPRRRVADLDRDAIEVFGRKNACGWFSTLGRRDASVTNAHRVADCSCSVGSACDGSGCTDLCGGRTSSGCGRFYIWACDGCYCA
ncbi:MAG TPA: bacteriocin fulvocin C-related protein [Actinopolymorphaceae bacterium]